MFTISRSAEGRGREYVYKRRGGAVPRKYIQPSQKMAACAVLFKKVESTGCKNYYRQHGKKKEEQF